MSVIVNLESRGNRIKAMVITDIGDLNKSSQRKLLSNYNSRLGSSEDFISVKELIINIPSKSNVLKCLEMKT